MAPYHHFADRAALIAAVAVIGFDRLFDQKLGALASAPADARSALIAGSRAYVAFILDNSELYRLMKGPDVTDRAAHPALALAAARPGAKLAELIAMLGPLSVPTATAAQMLWAFVHGLGLLTVDGFLGHRDAVLAKAEAGAAALLDGLAR